MLIRSESAHHRSALMIGELSDLAPLSLDELNILVFRYRFLGDTILTVPFLKRLREAYPKARVSVLVAPQSGVLLENCPYIDERIEFDTTRFHKYDNRIQPPRSYWDYISLLRKKGFDRAYLLKRSFSSALLAWLAGIPERIGFDTEWRGFLLTEKVKFDLTIHEAQNYLNHLPAPFSEAPAKSEALFFPAEAELVRARELTRCLDPSYPKIVIHAPAAHPLKQWKVEGWALLCQLLNKRGYRIIFSGAACDQSYYQEIIQAGAPHPDIDLTRAGLSLRENIAFYSLCQGAIMVDSGPMHLAAGVSLPVIGIFGPSDPRRWRPWSDRAVVISAAKELNCRPCLMKPSCQDYECLSELNAYEVFEAFERLLEEKALADQRF
ncbi:MAG: lipopolysaccharide heptosyltransferase II [Candidatus Caenarcaniphilales bacterium]|nr:lipopolysaccharide heptosyltransferase II [Candidatus Caenarcaniphilales bacterium]